MCARNWRDSYAAVRPLFTKPATRIRRLAISANGKLMSSDAATRSTEMYLPWAACSGVAP
jgi:hypothetical protein